MAVDGRAVLTPRRATLADLEALGACDAYARAHPRRRVELQRWVERGQCHVVEAGRILAGFVVVEDGFFGHDFVALVCVDPRQRRRGIGRLLLAFAQGQCRSTTLFTSTNASNTPARRLFEACGFAPSGVIENLDDGDPELVYCKRVASPQAGEDS